MHNLQVDAYLQRGKDVSLSLFPPLTIKSCLLSLSSISSFIHPLPFKSLPFIFHLLHFHEFMNHWISPQHSPYHNPPFGHPTVGPIAVPQQGQLGYSDPRRHRSDTLNSIQDFTPCCPTPLGISPNRHYLAQSPTLAVSANSHFLDQSAPFGISPNRHFPTFSPTVPEHTPNYTRKDTYWTNNAPTTITGVRQKVARTFVDYRAESKRLKRLAFLERLPFNNMSSSTALLPKDQLKKLKRDEHVSLRVLCIS